MQISLLGTFASQFCNPSNSLAFFFRLLDLLQHGFRYYRILVQIIIHLGLDEIAYILIYSRSSWFAILRYSRPHVIGTKLSLCLTFEHRFFYIQSYRGHNTVTDIGIFLVLVIKLLDGTGNMFLQCTLVCTALCGMLTIYERIIFLAVLIGMREGYFNVFSFQMNNVVKAFGSHVVLQQVFQSVTGKNLLSIIYKGQTRIEVSVITEQGFDKLILEFIIHKQRFVWFEEDSSTIFFRAVLSNITKQLSFFKSYSTHLPVAVTRYLETATQGVDGLQADTIQAYTFLKCLGVVLTTGIQLTDCFYKLSLRNSSPVVANADPQIVFNGYLYFLSGSHLELVDAVVHHFFQQHIYTVVALLTIAQATDVHPRADADMFHVVQMANVIFGIFYGWLYQFVVFFHGMLFFLQALFISSTAFMLNSLEIFPLCLHFVVQLQFRITFCIFKSKLLIYRNQIVEQQGINALVLIFRFHGYKQQVENLRIFFQENSLQQMIPTEWQQTTFRLLQGFTKRWHRNTYGNDIVFGIGNQCHHSQIQDRQEHFNVLLNLLRR